MKGIEISKEFYLQFGKPLIHKKFPELEEKIAIGLVGSGSECYGFDDEISTDHDFEVGFYMFIPDNFSLEDEFRLEHLYNELPTSFMGIKRHRLLPGENSKHGVIRISEFYKNKIGSLNLTDIEWLKIPSFYLLEATNGEVFYDKLGLFSQIRQSLSFYPHDILLKKLAGEIIMLYQSGSYNYERCYKRCDFGAAQLSIFEFVKHTLSIVYLLNNKYMPYYKWVFRGLKELTILNNLEGDLIYLISSDNSKEIILKKQNIVKKITLKIIDELRNQYFIPSNITDLDSVAFYINDLIEDETVRNLNILEGIN